MYIYICIYIYKTDFNFRMFEEMEKITEQTSRN